MAKVDPCSRPHLVGQGLIVVIGCRWIFNVKMGLDGQVDRLKALLVAKGYTQVHGQGYNDTFSSFSSFAKMVFVPLSGHGYHETMVSISIEYQECILAW